MLPPNDPKRYRGDADITRCLPGERWSWSEKHRCGTIARPCAASLRRLDDRRDGTLYHAGWHAVPRRGGTLNPSGGPAVPRGGAPCHRRGGTLHHRAAHAVTQVAA